LDKPLHSVCSGKYGVCYCELQLPGSMHTNDICRFKEIALHLSAIIERERTVLSPEFAIQRSVKCCTSRLVWLDHYRLLKTQTECLCHLQTPESSFVAALLTWESCVHCPKQQTMIILWYIKRTTLVYYMNKSY